MSGIAGICSKHALDLGYVNDLIEDMAEEITYVSADLVDKWNDDNLAIARVHHGVVNPETQPIFIEDGSVCIVMGGEVFDYDVEKRSLIDKGHHFRLRENDAEYCLHLYEEYGTEAFAKLNGSFLLSLYDRTTHELLLVNDRFSSHPLFYYWARDQLVFATQLRPLLRLQGLPRRLDLQAVYGFFTLQCVWGERTFYQDVKVLPSASVLRFRDGSVSLDRYWKVRYTNEARPERHYVEALADALSKAVARRSRGDYRLGILLSGGLDSRGVLAADDEGRISVAFTLADFESQELQIARKVAAIKGCGHVFLQRDIDHYARCVDEAVSIGDGMYRFDHAHFLGFFEQINKEVVILFNGLWLDVLFRGWALPRKNRRVAGKTVSLPMLRRLSLSALPDAARFELHESTLRKGVERLFRRVLLKQGEEYGGSLAEFLLKNKEVYGDNTCNAWEYLESHHFSKRATYLNLLCVRAHISERTIVFDNDLLNLHLSMPPQLRLEGRVYRKVFRKIAPELVVISNANTGLRGDMSVWGEWLLANSTAALQKICVLPRPQLPHPAYTNGSWPNKAELIRYSEKLKRLIGDTLHDPECIAPNLFDVEAIDSVFEKHINREEDSSHLLYLLLTFGRWHKKYGPR
jgi:asparagine synthase (glutamine-hydrolysing)